MNYCTTCQKDFASLSAFDEHRTGRHAYTYAEGVAREPMVEDGRRCFATHELTDAGWTTDEQERWRFPDDWEMQAWFWDSAAMEEAA
jgi:hypothetical protein